MFEYDTNPLLAESAFRLGLNWICVRESPHEATDDPEDQKYTKVQPKRGTRRRQKGRQRNPIKTN